MKLFYRITITTLVIFISTTVSIYAQNGPGGIGTTGGSSDLTLWLTGDENINYNSSKSVNTWHDKSGTGLHLSQDKDAKKPEMKLFAVNNIPTVKFDSKNTGLDTLDLTGEDLFGSSGGTTSAATIYFVLDSAAGDSWFHWKSSTDNGVDFSLSSSSAQFQFAGNAITASTDITQPTYHFIGGQKTASDQQYIYIDGTQENSDNISNSLTTTESADLFLGSQNGTTTNGWEGRIAEVIVYKSALSTVERRIAENYLSAKYDIPFQNSDYDYYAGDTPGNENFELDVIGIGRADGNTHPQSAKAGLYISENNNTLNNAGEYLFAGHRVQINKPSTNHVGGNVEQRWKREWFIDKTPGDGIDAKIAFDFSEGIDGNPPPGDASDYVLLHRNDTSNDFSTVGIADSDKGVENTDQVYFEVASSNLTDGYYTLGTKDKANSPVDGGNTWYTYYSGYWTNWKMWTKDPSGQLLKNPNKTVPGKSDSVVINNGHKIEVSGGGKETGHLEIRKGGELDLARTSGHDFTTIEGAGRIRLSSKNFPSGDASDFASNGTIEYYSNNDDDNDSYTITSTQPIHNLIVNLNTDQDSLTIADDYTISGDLRVNSGAFKINDDASTTPLTIEVGGNVTIQQDGKLTVGYADAHNDSKNGTYGNYHKSYHVMEVHGDFLNKGMVQLTNQSVPDYDTRAKSGAVSLVFKGEENTELRCKNTTDLYNLVIDKGDGQVYTHRIHSDETEYFTLYGINDNKLNYGSTAEQNANPETQKALWIKDGTLRLTGNIFIPSLTEGKDDFTIGEDAALVLDDQNVKVHNTADGSNLSEVSYTPEGITNSTINNQALSVMGKLQVNAGLYWLGASKALTFTNETVGEIVINGGELKANQIARDSVATFYQSGGTVRLTSNYTTNDNHALFHLSEPESNFTQTGGNIVLEGVSGNSSTNGIYIASKDGNYKVDGGEVQVNHSGTVEIHATVNFYDFTISQGTVGMQTPLAVSHDLMIQDRDTLTMNNHDLTLGGDFFLGDEAAYTHGTNTTTFNGEQPSVITVKNTTNPSEMTFNWLTVNKAADTAKVYFKSPGRTTDVSNNSSIVADIEDKISVENGIFDYGAYRVQILGESIYNRGIMGQDSSGGRFLLNASGQQTIETSPLGNPSYGHIELDNGNGAVLDGDARFNAFTLTDGIMDIGKNLMEVDTSEIFSTNSFDDTRMIITNSESGAKGLQLAFTVEATDYTGETLAFYPVGVSGRYTPMEVIANGTNSNQGKGTLAVAPVNEVHPAVPDFVGAIEYYWKSTANYSEIDNQIIDYLFTYDNDIPGNFFNPYVGYRFYEGSWDTYNNATGNPNILFDEMENVLTADFTAVSGWDADFFEATTFTSTQDGNWNDGGTWDQGGATPGDIDIVIIQPQHTVNTTIGSDALAGDVTVNGRLIINSDGSSADELTRVSGSGTIQMNSQYLPQNTNFDDFMNNDTAVFEYSAGTYDIPSSLDFYPTLKLSGNANSTKTLPAQDILVQQNLLVGDNTNTGVTFQMSQNGDMEIMDSLQLQNQGRFLYQAGGTGVNTVTINKSIDMNYNGAGDGNSIDVENAGSTEPPHKLVVKKDILTGNGIMDLWTADGNRSVDLYMRGDTASTITYPISAGNENLKLSHLYIDKEEEADSVFMQSDFILTDKTDRALHLQQGSFIMDNTNIDISLTSGDGDFGIPAGTNLFIRNGYAEVTGNNTGILLDGLLRLENSSQLHLNDASNDNYIEYTASGEATLDIRNSAELIVGSQIRRSTISTDGVLQYRQSGGTVTVAKNAAPNGSRGVFEILNTGSEFTHTGGTLSITQAPANTAFPAVYLDPETSSLGENTTLQIGNSNTTGHQNIGLYSAVSLNNLTLNGASGNIQRSPLTINKNLSIAADDTLYTNDKNVTIGGDLINNGGYAAGTNNTTFNGTVQKITGNTSFHTLKVNSSDTLSIDNDITINNDLAIINSVLADSGDTITVKGDITNSGAHSSSNASGAIVLTGNETQLISGGGNFGRIELDNPKGALLEDKATINGQLTLTTGKFRANAHLLTLNGTLAGALYGEDKMITTSGGISAGGIKRKIGTGNPDITFPIGVLDKYTPVNFAITSNNSDGYITLKPVDETHPTITAQDSALQYYWYMDNTGLGNFSATIDFNYSESDVPAAYPGVESEYIPAYLRNEDWAKFGPADVDAYKNKLYFSYSGADTIDGEYTTGLDEVIPDSVPTFFTVDSGDWNKTNIWRREGESDPGVNIPEQGPNGYIVDISHTVNVPSPDFRIKTYKTSIDTTGVLDVENTIGHYLGRDISGHGTISLGTGKLPGGNYNNFFSCDGGMLKYGGSDSYTMSDKPDTLRALKVTGTNMKTLPLKDILICDSLIIDGPVHGPVLDNETWNNKITINGELRRKNGSFYTGNQSGAQIIFGGNQSQTITDEFTGDNAFYNVKLSNPGGLHLQNNASIENNLVFEQGVIHTSATNPLSLTNTNTDVVSGVSDSTHVEGFLRKNIIDGGAFDFPVGDGGRLGKVELSSTKTNGTQTWETRYYNHDPSTDNYNADNYADPLAFISHNEYWYVHSPATDDTSHVKIRWDEKSGVPPDYQNDLRIARWDTINSEWANAGNNITANNGQSSGRIQTSQKQEMGTGFFTLASTSTKDMIWQGDIDTVWSKADNWNPVGVPGFSNDVTVPDQPYDPNISTSAQTRDLTVNSGAIVTVTPGYSLNVDDSLTLNGTLKLESGPNGNGIFNPGDNITGNADTVIVEQFLNGGEYHYITPQLNNVDTATYTLTSWGDINPNFYTFKQDIDTSDWLAGWEMLYKSGHNDTLNTGLGYIVYHPDDITYTMDGDISNIHTGTVTESVNFNNNGVSANGWNIIGNPYLTAIDADFFIDENAEKNNRIRGTLYFWDDDRSEGSDYTSDDYATYNEAGAVAGGGGTKPNGYIDRGQSFMVKVDTLGKTGPVTEDVVFNKTMQRTDSAVFFKKRSTKSLNAKNEIQRVRLELENKRGQFNETLLAFSQEATKGYDSNMDGEKLKGNPDIAFYSMLGDMPCAIQSYPHLDKFTDQRVEIPLGYDAGVEGEYTVNITEIENIHSGSDIVLKDYKTGAEVDIHEKEQYTFTTETDTTAERLALIINPDTSNINQEESNIQIYSYDQEIYIRPHGKHSQVKVYGMNGQLLKSQKFHGTGRKKIHIKQPGVYAVKVTTDREAKTKKVHIAD